MRWLAALVLVSIALTVPGCGRSGPVRIDATTKETAVATYKALGESLNEEEQKNLAYDIALLMQPAVLADKTRPDDQPEMTGYDGMKLFHGMTVDDIRKQAKSVRELMERGKGDLPPAPKAQP